MEVNLFVLVGNIFVGNILSLKYSEGESWRFSFSILHFRHDVPKLYYGLISISVSGTQATTRATGGVSAANTPSL